MVNFWLLINLEYDFLWFSIFVVLIKFDKCLKEVFGWYDDFRIFRIWKICNFGCVFVVVVCIVLFNFWSGVVIFYLSLLI